MNYEAYMAKWGSNGSSQHLNEEQGAQSHFLDLCAFLGVPKPGELPGELSGEPVEDDYLFERQSRRTGLAPGYADVFYRNHFAWENKAPGKNLDAALRQLQSYSLALSNPPLLVVCDRRVLRIHTQFNGHPSETHVVRLDENDIWDKRELLRRLWIDPESFRPKKTNRAITEEAAQRFAKLAEQLRSRGNPPEQVAHFLTQCLFCLFAEDVGLLPGRMFERIAANRNLSAERLGRGLQGLFDAMREGGMFGADDVPWFNGGLFQTTNVPLLEAADLVELRHATQLNWSGIDVSIFGTLFERGLDPAKRSQLGAHYTDPATIRRIVLPVIERPLLTEWAHAKAHIVERLAASKKYDDKAHKDAHALFITWLERLRAYRVLDPACGSGNFLYLGLKALKDIEHLSHTEAAALGLGQEIDLVTGPHNLLGLELNEYAAELARLTVWIGDLQWRIDHGYGFKTNPVLDPLNHIECRDALLTWVDGQPHEAAWPPAAVVIGNPPFLGGSKKRRELGDTYFEALATVYKGRVPAGADLVCYWFDKARAQIETSGLGAAGLVATQAIRAGSNRQVLSAIVAGTRIFDAWSDEPWVNEGAAVRVSLVSFGWGECCFLNGESVKRVSAELSGGTAVDMSAAVLLRDNQNTNFEGTKKYGKFDISGDLARQWLRLPNPHGRSNAEVVKPWRNGQSLTKRPGDTWIVDFGNAMSLKDAVLFEAPFQHVQQHVKVARLAAKLPNDWWLHERSRVSMREGLAPLTRFIATTRVAKHRAFSFLERGVLPDTRLNVIARSDDTTFGLLSSRMHELWSVAQASTHGVGNDPTYNAKSCFETFPFPAGLTPADTAHQRTEALEGGAQIPAGLGGELRQAAERIARAAHHLDGLRQNWLNPPEWTHRVPEVVPLGVSESPYPDRIEPKPGLGESDLTALQKRTLTNLYNQRPAWLTSAHAELDTAVATAYALTDAEGADFWRGYSASTPDEAVLARLLALNLARVAAEPKIRTKKPQSAVG